MKKGNISSAVFTGLFVGVIVFIRELLFPNISTLVSIIILALAASIGYLLGEKLFTGKNDKNNRKK